MEEHRNSVFSFCAAGVGQQSSENEVWPAEVRDSISGGAAAFGPAAFVSRDCNKFTASLKTGFFLEEMLKL